MLQILMSMTMESAFVILFFFISIRASKFYFSNSNSAKKIVVVVKIIIVILLVCILHPAAPTRLDAVNPDHAVCTGENVTYTCSVSGDLVTWYIQLGYNFEFTETATIMERIFDNILWRRVEYDSSNDVLQSTITFPAAVGMIACGNGSSSPTYNVSVQVQVEGIIKRSNNYIGLSLQYICTKCRSS